VNLYRLHPSPLVSAIWTPDQEIAGLAITVGIALTSCHRYFDGIPGRILIGNNMSQYPWILPDEKLTTTLPIMMLRNDETVWWVKESPENYYWMFYYFKALLFEYKLRFGKIHTYEKYVERLKEVPEGMNDMIVNSILTPWPATEIPVFDSPTWRKRKEPYWHEIS